jgi:4-amino-4-deoxy-L-arabinose transferase-like glycosyltransferase
MNKTKTYYAIIIFSIALVVRIILILNPSNNNLGGNDALGYHNTAVGILNHNSNFGFFREPGYIYFISGVYKIWNLGGGTVFEIENQTFDWNKNPEILFLRIIQAIFGSLTIVIFYFLIINFIKNEIALVIALISGLYLPLAYLSLFILRESIQFFILMSLSWALLEYVITNKIMYIILIGILWGVSNLFLQITYLLFIPYLIVFLLLIRKNILLSIRDFGIALLFMLFVISPWLYKSFSNYPDLRILKTMGCSLTFESVGFVKALTMENELGFISTACKEDILKKEWYLISDSDRFKKSFSGYYKLAVDSINSKTEPLLRPKAKINYYFSKTLLHFRLSMLQTFFWNKPEQQVDPISYYKNHKRVYFVMVFIVFSYLSIIGVFLFSIKLFPLLPVFFFFTSLFYFIGDETRRMLFTHPFLIMFSTLTVIFLFLFFIKKLSKKEIYSRLFVLSFN